MFFIINTKSKFERSLNANFIGLILNKSVAIDIKNFCPIGLVGGVYKIVTKFLANMLKVVVEKIICKP